MKFSYVEPDQWDTIQPWVNEACQHSAGIETPEGIKSQVMSGQALAVRFDGEGSRGVMVLEPIEGGTLHVTSIAGHGVLDHSHAFLDFLHCFARDAGCIGLSLQGRKGWTRVLRNHGFKEPKCH